MQNNPANPSTPRELFSTRFGLCSINTPFISPLRIVPSPMQNNPNDLQINEAQYCFDTFQLEDEPPANESHPRQQEVENSLNQVPREAPSVPQKQETIILDQTNMLQFILQCVDRKEEKLTQAQESLKSYGNQFIKRLFEYLLSKFRKMRKTKQELVKYCVRKSFKHITNKMRAANKQAYAQMENNQVVAEYFEIHCEGDTSISMPFKKNSELKTMNTVFLKKIFQCRQYNIDYKEFLKQFPADYNFDNRKKIKSMNETLKKCVKSKTFKGIDEYKRLPWTIYLLDEAYNFANKLFIDYSPFKNEKLENSRNVPQQTQKKAVVLAPKKIPVQKKYRDEFIIIKSNNPRRKRSETPIFSDPFNFSEEEEMII